MEEAEEEREAEIDEDEEANLAADWDEARPLLLLLLCCCRESAGRPPSLARAS